MGRYILKRIFLVLPTLLLVMMLAFFLSKFTPGDAAESMLLLHGIQADDSRATREYERNYKLLHLDKPTFYFSVMPDFYPTNIHSIVSPVQRQQTRSLLSQKYTYSDISDYFKYRDLLLLSLVNENNDSLNEVSRHLQQLRFETEALKIKALLTSATNLPLFQPSAEFLALGTHLDHMLLNQSKWYYPVFYWHGPDNQFHIWATNIFRGNFGTSMKDGRLVTEKLAGSLSWTMILILLNVVLSSVIAIPSGLVAGYYENSLFDKISNFIWLLLYAMPVFWFASLLIIYFTSGRYGAWMNIFPTPGIWYIPEGQGFFTSVYMFSSQLVLPVICLIANDIAQLSRITRNNVLEQKSKLYFLMAKAKGLTHFQVMKKHILPNTLIPLITITGNRIPAGISGALIIEVIFNIPGMGRLLFESITSADWQVVFGVLLVISFFATVFMLLTDIFYAVFNPKIKFDRA